MIVFLILAWLHSSACVDCTVLSLQMTSIWTVSIWHAFIYVGSRKAIFRWVSHFPSSFVDLTDQTLLWSFDPFAKCTLNAVFFFIFYFFILGTYLKRNLLGGIWELMIAPHMFVQLAIWMREVRACKHYIHLIIGGNSLSLQPLMWYLGHRKRSSNPDTHSVLYCFLWLSFPLSRASALMTSQKGKMCFMKKMFSRWFSDTKARNDPRQPVQLWTENLHNRGKCGFANGG